MLSALAVTLSLALPAPVHGQAAAPKADPAAKVVHNLKDGLAIEGYDPVSYFNESGPLKGSDALTASYLGGQYRFATAANRDRFVADPARYAPQYGGYCGYGASRGYLAPVDPEAYTIMNGRLILQNSKSVLKLWQKEPEARLKMADANWPSIVEKEGKPIPQA